MLLLLSSRLSSLLSDNFSFVTFYSSTSRIRLDDLGVEIRVPVGSRISTFLYCPGWLRGPPGLLSNWYRGTLSPGVKRQGRETDHSHPTSAEVDKTWIYTSTLQYIFKCLISYEKGQLYLLHVILSPLAYFTSE
jgi:hypothetical protein